MVKILAFDTATDACSVALLYDNEIHERFEIAPRRHSALILPMVDELLNARSMVLADLDAIAFGQGPGSFMGLRIAAGVAQGLAFGAGLPVVPVSSLQALAQVAYLETGCQNILVGWDARMDAIYWGAYRLQDKFMCPMISDTLSSPAEIVLPDENDWLAAGNAWQVYAAELPELVSNRFYQKELLFYPAARAVARLAAEKYIKDDFLVPANATPVYLRNQVAKIPERML